MSYHLFLDDFRQPSDVGNYINPVELREKYRKEKWYIVRNYEQFCQAIKYNGLPELISFDHDLSDGHYHKNMQEGIINYNSPDFECDAYKTGFHCASWLIDYCLDHNLPLPKFLVHSMNPVGRDNILALLSGFPKSIKDSE